MTHLPEVVSLARIGEAIEAAGYQVREVTTDAAEDRERAEREAEIGGLRRDVIFAASLTVPLFLVAMLRMLPGPAE